MEREEKREEEGGEEREREGGSVKKGRERNGGDRVPTALE